MSNCGRRKREDSDLSDLDPDCVEGLIKYCYTGQLSLDRHLMEWLTEAVNFLGIEGIMADCDLYLRWMLIEDNAQHWYSIAQSLSLPVLTSFRLQFLSVYT